MEQFLISLNDKQRMAVTYSLHGSVLVLAGAGSGKTKVLTSRLAWLILDAKIPASRIMAVTFTNKAAKEMMLRINGMIGNAASNLWVGTFHSLALKMLSRHHQEANLPAYFQILDAHDQLGVMKRIIKLHNLDEEHYAAKDLQKFINKHKENGDRAINVVPYGMKEEQFLKLYVAYEQLCNKDGLVDFTELLLRSYELLKSNTELLTMYQNLFQHILIDEFQDTNYLQYQWLTVLAGTNTKLFAVGDDDQSIYAFRGAKVGNMQSFLQDFKVSSPICLEQNYRSTPNILAAANAVITNNTNRIGKNLWTDKLLGDKIKLYEAYTEEDEAYFVADEIRSLIEKGYRPSEIGVLYRSNAQSRVLEQSLYNQGVAYRVYGGLRFFDRQEVKHALAYLRLIINDNDNDAFLRIANFPARGIGAVAIAKIQETATMHGASLLNAIDYLDGKSAKNFSEFANLIKQIRQDILSLDFPEAMSYIIEKSGLRAHYAKEQKLGAERLENLNELVSAVTNFVASSQDNGIQAFLAHAVLEATIDTMGEVRENAVQLQTVHTAKGLEFKIVFLVGLEDGLFPHENCLGSENELEEERRLMYVAITRAMEKLYFLRACSRLTWGKRLSAPISRFINEIPGELISNISGISDIGVDNLLDFGVGQVFDDGFAGRSLTNLESKTSRVKIFDSNLTIKIGDMVKHAKFGNGKVMQLNVDGSKMLGEIFFIGVGRKTLDLNIAKIEKC